MRWIAATLALIFAPLGVKAHSLEATYKIDATAVHVEAFYDNDDAAAGAKVAVTDAGGATVVIGATDDKGRWSFPRPKVGHYSVEIDAGLGHRKRLRIIVPAEAADTAIDQPTREDMTRFPWLGLAVGLAAIGAIAVVANAYLKRRRAGAPKSENLS